MSRLRIGIVGAGGITRNMHLPVLQSMPRVQVDWIADVVAARAVETARAYGVARGVGVAAAGDLPEADVVLLAIPPKPRAAYYEHLSAQGVAVFAEKPFALTVADHLRFQSLFPAHRVGCGYMRRFYSNNRLLRRIVGEQWFGPLQSAQIAEGGRTTKTGVESSYLDLPSADGGGVIHDYACHTLDLCFEISGAAQAEVVMRDVVFDGQTDRRVHATIRLHGPRHAPIDVDYTCSWLDRQSNSIRLLFPTVIVETATAAGAPVTVRAHDAPLADAAALTASGGATTMNQAFYLQWTSFLDGLASAAPSAVAAATCLPVTKLVDDLLALPQAVEVAG